MPKAMAKFSGRLQMQELEIHPSDLSATWNGNHVDLSEHSLEAPISGTVYGTLLNYQGALDQMGESLHNDPYKSPPKAPILYIKPKNTIIAHQSSIPMPEDESELEVGACLGVVIGEKVSQVREEDAIRYIAGYTIVNDVSVPHESMFRPAVKHKARDGFCPAGPWVIERDAVPNPDNLSIRVYVNGECRQESHTVNLIRSVSQLIEDVTEFMTLEKGDTLLVGIPEHAPLVSEGDRVRIEIEQVGVLENVVGKEVYAGRNQA